MKTAKEVLDEVTKGCGIVSEQHIIKAMEQFAVQFIHATTCWQCDGKGKFSEMGNMTCQNCQGAGKLIVLPTISNT